MNSVALFCNGKSQNGDFSVNKKYICWINHKGQPVAKDDTDAEVVLWDEKKNTLPAGWTEWLYD